MRKLAELTPAEQARILTPGLPAIEVIAIAGTDQEFYEAMKSIYPNSPHMWRDLPGAPTHSTLQSLDRQNRFFRRYFEMPDFDPKIETRRSRLFHEPVEDWDFDNPGASHD